jgi:hypothetical protein
MGLLKPVFLQNATSAADVQRLMKADLKNSIGKKNVKFLAAKHCTIGGRKINLFIMTDTPAPFEAVLKANHPKANRAKGTCDIVKDKETGDTQVTITRSTGQILPAEVAKLMPLVVANDKSFVAKVAQPSDKLGDKPTLRSVPKKEDGGVAQWARDKYRAKSKKTVMASMTSDGKIGSVYFDDGSRIRTTHSVGPAKEQHDKARMVQFNVDEGQAQGEYNQSGSKLKYDTWLQQRLVGITPSNAPKWAKIISTPDEAHDRSTSGNPTGRETLIEIFKTFDQQLKSWHPSRGTGTKLEIDKQTISVLQAAIKHVDEKYPKPNDHEELDPQIVERRNKIWEEWRSERANPNPQIMQALWKDKYIAGRMLRLGLKTPTIAELDQDSKISARINKIFTDQANREIKTDNTIKLRLKAIQETRKLRNKEFYDFVKARLPNAEIVKAMRDPGSV